jgi:hypothetical protein
MTSYRGGNPLAESWYEGRYMMSPKTTLVKMGLVTQAE